MPYREALIPTGISPAYLCLLVFPVTGENPLFAVRILEITNVQIRIITIDDRGIAAAWCVVIANPQ
jgi:hypothetical protein